MIRNIWPRVMLLAGLGLAGCSHFDQQWKAPLPLTSHEAALPLSGRWDGTWQSQDSHGDGGLRAIIVPVESPAPGTAPQRYQANFQAVFMGGLKADYTLEMTTTYTGLGRIKFQGSKDLGPLGGGVYTYEGEAVNGDMTVRYTSANDHGTFTMKHVMP